MTVAPERHEIRKLTAVDVDVIAPAMARAFADDPLQVWVFPDASTRLATLEQMFGLQIRHGSLPAGESYTDATLSVAALWAPPGAWELDAEAAARMRPLATIVGDAIGRLQAAYDAMLAAHPAEPHYYLAGVGTDPARQAHGLASAAMAPVLKRADRDGVPAYLESTKERNVGFYERRGFRVTSTIAPAPDGPTMWCMWREPS